MRTRTFWQSFFKKFCRWDSEPRYNFENLRVKNLMVVEFFDTMIVASSDKDWL